MSADLFALFDAPVQAPEQPQQNVASSASQFSAPSTDPFSFLQPATAPASAHPQATYQAQAIPTQWPSRPPQQPVTGDIWGGLTGQSQPASTAPAAEEEDDGWGDFETPAQTAPPPAPASVVSPARPTTRIVRAPTIDLMTNNLLNLDASPQKPERFGTLTERPSWESSTRGSTESRPKNADPNVLFDADDFDEGALPDEEDDDFGDFEAPAPAPAPVPPPTEPSLDLLSTSFAATHPPQARQASPSHLLSALSLNDASSIYPQPPRSPSFQERNPFPGLGLKTPVSDEFPKQAKPRSPSPITAWPTFEKDDSTEATAEKNSFEAEWGAFDDQPPKAAVQPQEPKPTTTRSSKNPTTETSAPNSDWAWDDWSNPTPPPSSQPANPARTASSPQPGPPPTNIPPPSVLLSIFPSLLSTAPTTLFKPTASAPPAVKDRIHSSPATQAFLRGYLALATVAARLIAGRRLRWHRDRFLSQSMTISAATGGGKGGGMKLAGIDRSQSAREDREAADVVAAWRGVVGRLRTAVAAANAAAAAKGGVLGGRPLKVPELAEVMRVETVKGALTAPRACVVCGLRRDERVAKVDFEVEDSFGEWWVEFWGHRECRNFWLEHEVALRSR
ncbi:hypothetical protein BR93DRAFT_993287 [Coniochaeta sp. PMI_546]|nr:hypothetical protein BR93DRAFT_993287 [Coniochaeta sp. PMI_546]